MLVDSMDGIYFLVSSSFDSDEPPIPANVGALDVAAAPEALGISTYGNWSLVDIIVEETPGDVGVDLGAWDSVAEAEFTASGPLTVVSQEFEPAQGIAQVTDSGGRFAVRVTARSVESVIRLGTQTEAEPTEQHIVHLWRLVE